MNETKKWYASRGVHGSLMNAAAIGLAAYATSKGVDVSPDETKIMIDEVYASGALVLGSVGTFIAFIGRLCAKKKIG